jgi:long-chain fatty acid transport protein
MKSSSWLFIGLLWLHPLPIVLASPLFGVIGDTTGSGAQQARTLPGGAAAAYFNPSLLSEAPASATIGFTLLNERIGVVLDGRPGPEFGIAAGLTNAVHADGRRFETAPLPTNLLQFGRPEEGVRAAFDARPRQAAGSGHDVKTYEVIGIVLKLLDGRVGLGLHALLPNREFMRMRVFFSDEREHYFSNSVHPELYGDRMTALSFATGIGARLTRDLSLGIGAAVTVAADVTAPTYVVDAGDLGKVLLDLDGRANMNIAPHFGASYKLADRVRLSASVHTSQKLVMDARYKFLLPTGLEQSSALRFVLNYMPWQASLGGSWDALSQSAQTLTLAGSLVYAGWSSYEDRHGERPLPAYAWSDTLSATIGARYRMHDLSASFDYSYIPTPVPPQTGRTNYADNDRVAASLGAEYAFHSLDTSFRFGAQVQAHRLVPRHQEKLPTPTNSKGEVLAPERVRDELPDDAQVGGEPVASAGGLQTNNPGWPGFSSGGWILGASVYLTMSL